MLALYTNISISGDTILVWDWLKISLLDQVQVDVMTSEKQLMWSQR